MEITINRVLAAIDDQMALGYRRTLRSGEVWKNTSLWIIGGLTPRNKSTVKEIGLENLEKYAELTRKADWEAICELNDVRLDSFGTKKEIKVLTNHLEAEEVVFALTSGIVKHSDSSNSSDFGSNTWLAVLTDQRFLFLDCAMLTNSVDTQSIRHDRVQAVSSSQGFLLGKIMVDLGSRVLTIDNCQKATVSVMATLANRWLQELNTRRQSSSPGVEAQQESPLDKLTKLANLRAMGALTDEEFNTVKAKIIAQF